MPKERRNRSVSFEKSRVSPFPCSSSRARQSKTKDAPESEENVKEWEEARCPVCLEHPHNAVLLMCSSHDKGCRPYMCDTSYRHSNCLDQFRKSFLETPPPDEPAAEVASSEQPSVINVESEETVSNLQIERSEQGSSTVLPMMLDIEEKLKLVCPLCRGKVTGWTIVDSARRFMNAKSRSCASETCDFCGTYADLRKHARQEHPLVRPSEADPERARNWRRLEQQRDFGDLISTLQSLGEESSEENFLSFDDQRWLTVFFLIRVFRHGNSSRSSSWSGSSRARGHLTVRRRLTELWGETPGGENRPGMRDGDNSDANDGVTGSRRTHWRHRELSSLNDDPSSRSSSWSSHARARAQVTIRRRSTRLLGETYEGGTEPATRDGVNNEVSDDGTGSRRTRRRLRQQSTPDDER